MCVCVCVYVCVCVCVCVCIGACKNSQYLLSTTVVREKLRRRTDFSGWKNRKR